MDHSKVTTKGCLYSSMGKTHDDQTFSGGCIFVDHATGHDHVEHLVNFTTTETILAKHCYEKHMLDMGISIQAYQSDNGIFATCGFLDEIYKGFRNIKFSGVGAHHQNGITERAIHTILMKAYTIMIPAALRWPDMTDPSLWPTVVDYCIYHHNHYPCPAAGMLAPLDLLQRTKITHLSLQNMHVWGCPCYVLEPTHQDDHELPKLQPHSCHAVFVGFSSCHTSLVPLVLNTWSDKISPKYHVVFEDLLTGILSLGATDAFDPLQWQELFAMSHFQYSFDDDDPIQLAPEWTTDELDHHDHTLCND